MFDRLRLLMWIACGLSTGVAAQEDPPVTNLEVGDETAVEADSGVCKSPDEPPGALRTNQVIIEGRWAGKLELPLKSGDPLTAEKASAALNTLREAISRSSPSYFNSVGEMHVLTVTGDCERQPDGSVNFILKPRFAGLSVVRMGDNVLPIARWREPRPYKEIPPIVRTLQPSLGAGFDDLAGTELSVAVKPRLYQKAGTAASPNEHDLTAEISATHSVDESPHSDAAALAWNWRKPSGHLRSVTLSANYADERELLGDLTHDRDARGAAAGLMFKLKPNTRLYVDAGYANQHDNSISDDVWSTRLLYETIPRPVLGFARASLWASDASGYRQLIARAAYGKEWSLRPNQNLGVEVTVGGGKSWGDVPDYARFSGGSAQQEFLYQDASSSSMLTAPGGPLLRSFGANGAHLGSAGTSVGGTRFWHVNLDLALPIARWSMPLIPNESSDITLLDNDEPLTIKQIMQNQVDSGPNFLQPILVQRGLSPAEAKRQAAEVFEEIGPAARYVINDANIYSVKPMLLVDVAGLSDGSNSETWAAVGLGVQVTIVTARFEAGYSQTISGPTPGSRGAPFARLVFQRLF